MKCSIKISLTTLVSENIEFESDLKVETHRTHGLILLIQGQNGLARKSIREALNSNNGVRSLKLTFKWQEVKFRDRGDQISKNRWQDR